MGGSQSGVLRAAELPGHLLEMQILGPTWDLLNQKCWGGAHLLCFNTPHLIPIPIEGREPLIYWAHRCQFAEEETETMETVWITQGCEAP